MGRFDRGVSSACGGHPIDACAVIQAGVSAAIGRQDPVYPEKIRASSRELDLAHWTNDAWQEIGLKKSEVSDLLAQKSKARPGLFQPTCNWFGRPLSMREGTSMTSEFTRPLFSSDGRLAIFEWSLLSTARWRHGTLCVLRRTGDAWVARCMPSWTA